MQIGTNALLFPGILDPECYLCTTGIGTGTLLPGASGLISVYHLDAQ